MCIPLKTINEERISKSNVIECYKRGVLSTFNDGTIKSLQLIHKHVFDGVFDFAGTIRTVTISKDGFCFAPSMFLHQTLMEIDSMKQSTIDDIIEKYVEMNIAHPFLDGNGRSMRIWLNLLLKKELNKVVDWRLISKNDYLTAMKKSPVDDSLIKSLIKKALVVETNEVFLEGLDVSFDYEGLNKYTYTVCRK